MKTLVVCLAVVLVLCPILALAQQKTLKATATAHSVDLSWVQSATVGVNGNKVYRSAGACPGTGNVSIASTVVPALTYSDTSVVGGQSYCYYVTATCPTTEACSGESAPSNTVTVAVPVVPGPQPLPPGNVTATPH